MGFSTSPFLINKQRKKNKNMLYIYKKRTNTIITDNVVDYIPSSLDVYLDDELIGTYVNESSDKNYLIVSIPSGDTETLNNCEYKIKFVYYEEPIKVELISVKDLTVLEPIINKTKTKSIKYYE